MKVITPVWLPDKNQTNKNLPMWANAVLSA